MVRWKKTLRDYFIFNKREWRGTILWLFLVFILLIVQLTMRYWPQEEYRLSEEASQRFDQLVAAISVRDSAEKDRRYGPKEFQKKHEKEIELFYFDPNTVDSLALDKLGMPHWQIKNMIKYRKRGGFFESGEDLLKLYGLDTSWFETIAPYVRIEHPKRPDRKWEDDSRYAKNEATESPTININSASAEDFARLKGIGPVLSQRIIDFRNKLGGFVSPLQIKEVYGLKSEVFENMKPYLKRDSARVRKIDINRLSSDSMAAHPYISYKLARVLYAYRAQHGNFKNPSDLQKTGLVDDSLSLKLAPYLNFD